ncbi:MAG: sigma-54 dependent transcriptional regulator [Candidatus Omnitrophica bacterium]|nr:sigma-54 dependent transcriptional regulator [Candidatus Omnitrophota bacterium]
MQKRYLEKVLIIDDDKEYCEILENTLTVEGFRVESVYNGEEGLLRVQERQYTVVILDLTLPDISGMQILKRIKEINPTMQVIIVTASDTVGSAIESLKAGAFNFITKPIMFDDVVVAIKKAIQYREKTKQSAQDLLEKEGKVLIGCSEPMEEISRIIAKVAPTDTTILITGESGTGKEIIAHRIYKSSKRKNKPFVKISCAALPETLLESELFGYLKGAFTGATSQKKGLFEVAQGGTLFLDEISEVSPTIQAKLLRALQEREIKPLGGTQDVPIDVRFIAATNKELKEEITQKKFREDLYYRLNVITITTPPLRERKDDIPLLVEHFIKKYKPTKIKELKRVEQTVLDCFAQYHWPGNIRELENVIERAIILGVGDTISISDIPERLRKADGSYVPTIKRETDSPDIPALDDAVITLERNLITRALEKSNGVVSAAAKLLHIKRTTLIAKMKKLDLK